MKKILLYVVLGLVAILIAIFILLGRYTDRVIDPYVRSLLENTKPMGHKIEYSKIRVNLFQKVIILKQVRMFPDSALTENDLKFEVNVKEVRLTGFSIREMLFDKTLTIDEFLIEKPEVVVTLPLEAKEVIEDVKKEEPPKKSSQLLKKIMLSKITLEGGSFKLIRNDIILASSPNITIYAKEINLEKNSKDEPIGFTYGDYTISLTTINLHSESSLYDITLGSFTASKNDLTILLNNLVVSPKYDKKEFSKKLDFQNDRFDLKIKEMAITHTGLWKLLENKPLEITMLRIDSLDADIYRDKNVAFNFNRFPTFYNESFRKIDIPLLIDTVMITNSRINYGELVAERPSAGNIRLENFELQTYNLTTLVEEDTNVNVMHIYVQAKVMGEGPLNAELILPLEGNLRVFECSGSVGSMQLSPLNDMLEPSINMKFNAGKVNRMTFYFKADDNASKGWMEFLYNDIDVVLLKKDPDKQWGFVSLLANTMTLSNNPAPGKDLKIVEIGYERDKNKGIINYVWKTIQSGMIHTILPIKKYQINRKGSEKEATKTDGKKEKKKQKN
jgi:hypothetical protein